MTSFTKGRFLAFLFSAVFVFLLWGYVFTPNGLGANIVLGIAIAIAFVYMMTTNIGPFLDDLFFHGGSRERALALRRAEATARQVMTRLDVHKSTDQNAKEACRNAVSDLFATVNAIRAKHATDAKGIASDIKRAKDAEERVERAFEACQGRAFRRAGLFTGWLSLAGALAAALALRIFIVEPYQIPSGSMIPTLLVGDHLFVSKLSYGVMNPFSKQPHYLARWNTPQPGEVIIFQAPAYVGHNAGETWIKRVIAGPGQTVRLADTVVYVDEKPYPHLNPLKEVKYDDFIEGTWDTLDGLHTIEEIGSVKHDIYQNPDNMKVRIERNWPTAFSGPYPGLDCDAKVCRVKEGHVFVMGDNRGHSSDGRIWGALPIENIKGRALFVWMSVDGSTTSVNLGRFTLPGFRWNRSFQGIN